MGCGTEFVSYFLLLFHSSLSVLVLLVLGGFFCRVLGSFYLSDVSDLFYCSLSVSSASSLS